MAINIREGTRYLSAALVTLVALTPEHSSADAAMSKAKICSDDQGGQFLTPDGKVHDYDYIATEPNATIKIVYIRSGQHKGTAIIGDSTTRDERTGKMGVMFALTPDRTTEVYNFQALPSGKPNINEGLIAYLGVKPTESIRPDLKKCPTEFFNFNKFTSPPNNRVKDGRSTPDTRVATTRGVGTR